MKQAASAKRPSERGAAQRRRADSGPSRNVRADGRTQAWGPAGALAPAAPDSRGPPVSPAGTSRKASLGRSSGSGRIRNPPSREASDRRRSEDRSGRHPFPSKETDALGGGVSRYGGASAVELALAVECPGLTTLPSLPARLKAGAPKTVAAYRRRSRCQAVFASKRKEAFSMRDLPLECTANSYPSCIEALP